MDTFYQKIDAFNQFPLFTENQNYEPVPEDWIIFLTDVVGSTKAIEQGLYKEVNLVGAATISSCVKIQNKHKLEDFPFVFGGDGATVCVPNKIAPMVAEELRQLQKLSLKNFKLKLRVAQIPVTDIYKDGYELLVGKFQVKQGKAISIFRGGGLAQADVLAKQHYDKYKISENENSRTMDSLDGLSCRWKPIPATKGLVLSLIISHKSKKLTNFDINNLYQEIINNLENILGNNIESANPIQTNQLSGKSLKEMIKGELKYHKNVLSFIFSKRLLEILAVLFIFRNKVLARLLSTDTYVDSMRRHSDFIKFDDTLKMVIDCSSTQKDSIINYLESIKKKVFYGHHTSKEAIMTCYVGGLSDGKHIHFVDGGNGGYALAAKKMKEKIKQETSAN